MSWSGSRSSAQADACFAEVVLAVLLENFNFSPTDKEVWWNLCPVVYPTMSKDDAEPSLVLAVSRSKQVQL